MNPRTAKEAVVLAKAVARGARLNIRKVDIVLAPPFPFLVPVAKLINKSKLGAQDVFWERTGAYTGEISIEQLKALKVHYIIIGHSERRSLGETNEIIHKKLKMVLGASIKAVLCVGEREHHSHEAFPLMVRNEIHEALKSIKKSLLKNLIIAYEPIWAISTEKNGKPALPKDIFEITVLIRRELFHLFGNKRALRIPILYGGSVNDKNAALFVSEGRVDGLLIGGASLNAKMFVKIIDAISRIWS